MNQAGGRTDGRQCGIAQILAYNPGVESVIKLLEQIAQKNGESKQENLGPDGTFCQIMAGGMGFVMVIVKSVAVEWHVRHFLNIAIASVILWKPGKVNTAGN